MSIIQEALKKAQENSETPKTQKREDVFRKKGFGIKPFLAIAIIGLSVLVIGQPLFKGIFLRKEPAKTVEDPAAHQEVAYKPIAPKITEPVSTQIVPSPQEKSHETRPVEAAPAHPKFILNGIMYLKSGPRAIINDSTVMEGDSVSGAKVGKINKNSVILNFNNLEITLSLKK